MEKILTKTIEYVATSESEAEELVAKAKEEAQVENSSIKYKKETKNKMADVYKPLTDKCSPILFTSIETAELIKYASNAFLATKITFINEIADIYSAWWSNNKDKQKIKEDLVSSCNIITTKKNVCIKNGK